MDTYSLSGLFEHTARNYPDNPAIRCNEGIITYSELDEDSNRLANFLLAMGLKRRDRVAILLPRSADAYRAILATLKCGCSYVPIDPDYPSERVEYIMEDSGARALLTYSGLLKGQQKFSGVTVTLDTIGTELSKQSPDRPPQQDETDPSSEPAYIIYTSGTTGKPKGVIITQRNIVSLVQAEGRVFGLKWDDVVAQAASLSFDVSVEEMWLAFHSGASLVPVPQEVSSIGSRTEAFLSSFRVTVLSTVPTRLSLMASDIPSLRLIILGGEACPDWVVSRWYRPGRRIVNTYGPTETTVAATYSELIPGKPVTIGVPLPGYSVYILDSAMNRVGDGETGEIYIGGPGVGAGYVGLEEKTSASFIHDPFSESSADEMMYRTGDLGRYDENGEIEFHGRADSQVKLRGFRIELEEIESAIMQQGAVQAAACCIKEGHNGVHLLVAYLVARDGYSIKPDEVRTGISESLPSYMIPNIFQILEELPRLPTGKLDRNSLPTPVETDRKVRRPSNDLEKAVLDVWSNIFSGSAISTDDDFFLDLGGHSLLAAKVVSELRKDDRFSEISVADIYQNTTIQTLAALGGKRGYSQNVNSGEGEAPKEEGPVKNRKGISIIAKIAQTAGLYVVYFFQALEWITPYLIFFLMYETGAGLVASVLWAALGAVLTFPALVALAIAVKWIALGRIKPGRYKLWGSYHIRWWFVQSVINSVPLDYLEGTPLLPMIYRLLGAKIGSGVYLGSTNLAAFDLTTIGDETSIEEGTSLFGYTVENGELLIGPIRIGSHCFVGERSILNAGTSMEDFSRLEELSYLTGGEIISSWETWKGSPASYSYTGNASRKRSEPQKREGALTTLKYAALSLSLPLVVISVISPGVLYIMSLNPFKQPLLYAASTPLVGASFVLLLMAELAVFKRILLRNVKPGKYPVHGSFYFRHWVFERLQALTIDLIGSLRATLYTVPWFRMLGAKVGKSVELSTAAPTIPDLLEIDYGGTIADEVSFGTPHIEGGYMTIGHTRLGRKAFLGNSSVVPSGTRVGDGSLIGVLSISPKRPSESEAEGATWLGSPPIRLPAREKNGAYTEERTYDPPLRLKIKRALVELLRITIPPAGFILVATTVLETTLAAWRSLGLWQSIALIPVWYAIAGGAMSLLVALAKWLVVGKYKPFTKPLWSGFVWRLEFVNALYEFMASPLFLEALRGTPYIAPFERLMGAKIGKDAYIDTTGFLEWDLVEIGDRVCLNRDSVLQTHLFEDRVLKGSSLKVDDDCSIGSDSVVLYDSIMEKGSQLDSLSLLTKGETLKTGTRWVGIPARSIGRKVEQIARRR